MVAMTVVEIDLDTERRIGSEGERVSMLAKIG